MKSNSPRLSRYLAPERVAVTRAPSKHAALEIALDLFRDSGHISDQDAFAEAIWQREEVLPTGIGLGIGVPHVRMKAVRNPAASLVVLREGVDYGSLDGESVRVILLIAMPEDTHHRYLEYLARASRLFQDTAFRQSILEAPTSDELWSRIREV